MFAKLDVPFILPLHRTCYVRFMCIILLVFNAVQNLYQHQLSMLSKAVYLRKVADLKR